MKYKPYQITSTTDLAVKDVDTSKRTVTGYFAAFGNIDSHNDIIVEGAFAKTLAERGPSSAHPRIKHLWQHDAWSLIGAPSVLKEDSHGLYFETTIAKTRLGDDVLTLYQEGVITEHSIGYHVIDSSVEQLDSGPVQRLKEIRLFEGSAVTWGSNPNTPVTGIKSIFGDDDAIERKILSLRKVLESSNISDEIGASLDIYMNQLITFFKENHTAEKDSVGVQPRANDLTGWAASAMHSIDAKFALIDMAHNLNKKLG